MSQLPINLHTIRGSVSHQFFILDISPCSRNSYNNNAAKYAVLWAQLKVCHFCRKSSYSPVFEKSSRFYICERTLYESMILLQSQKWKAGLCIYIDIRCCYMTVDSRTTALQNGACSYPCISKQMNYKTPFSPNGYMTSLEFNENYITLFCLEKNS